MSERVRQAEQRCPHPGCAGLAGPHARYCPRCGRPVGADAEDAGARGGWWLGLVILALTTVGFLMMNRPGGILFAAVAFGLAVPVTAALSRRPARSARGDDGEGEA